MGQSITDTHKFGLGPVNLQAELSVLLIEHAESFAELVGSLTEQGGVISVFHVLQGVLAE